MNTYIIGIITATVITVFVFAVIRILSKSKDIGWKKDVLVRINSLEQKLNSSDISRLSHILIESDKLLDHVYKNTGIKGQTLGERLKNAKNKYPKAQYNSIWEAHKLRNRVAHELDFRTSAKLLKDSSVTLLKGAKYLL